MKEKKISIIISVYNEENAIDKFFEEFDKIKNQFKWDYEIIFVNDGSNDNSLKMLYEYAARDEKAKIISFSRNFGHEAAMIAGIDNASASSFNVNTGGIFTGAFGSISGFFTGSGLIKAPGPDVFFFFLCS